ncbi:helix-turn-helix domain-containing protein [Haliea sp. E17]|uniref:helix-turn-helix domain-containing protein n=1 Tax=Haliea sp. E17 TaxID=3401576 RepID=UPI003AAB9B91
MKGIGQRLQLARKKKGLTQKELASAIGCSQQTIVDIESQDDPKSRFLLSIINELGESMEWITSGLGSSAIGGHSTALPHLDLESIAAWSASLTAERSAIDYLFWPPLQMSQEAFTVGVDRMMARAMCSHMKEGDVIFIDPEEESRPGDVVLATMPGWPRAEPRMLSVLGSDQFLEIDSSDFGSKLTSCVIYNDREKFLAHKAKNLPALIIGKATFIGRPL